MSPLIVSGTAWMHHLAREFDKEVGKAREVLALDPNFLMAHYRLGEAALAQGRLPDAITAFEKALELSDNSPDLVVGTRGAARIRRQPPVWRRAEPERR